MYLALRSESHRRQALRQLYRALENNETPPRGFVQDDVGLCAALGPAPHTTRAWFLERLPSSEMVDVGTKRVDAYRAYCFDPTHTQKPTTDPQAHIRGEFLTTQLVTCQLFILDLPPERFQSSPNLAVALRAASEQFEPTLRANHHLQEKTTVHSVREVLALYRQYHYHPVEPSFKE